MAEGIIFALALALIGAAGTAVALALRTGTLTGRAAELAAASSSAEKQLQVTAREFADYKLRTDAQLTAAAADAKELRDDLEKCNAPGTQRARLDSLLGKLAPRSAPTGARDTGPLPALPGARADDTDPEH